ncbi:MAG: MATE family efflux transporter [Rhodopirellula sp.]|nr:MATE family efflux transporter [Rhodopirellula sp.]
MTEPDDRSIACDEPTSLEALSQQEMACAGITSSNHQLTQFLSGNPRTTILLLALPVLAEQFLNFLVGFVDTILSGRISTAATSAIGAAAYVNWLAELIFSLVATGTTALVARHWGAGQRDSAGMVATSSISLALGMGVGAAALLYLIAPVFGEFLNLEPASSALLVRYLRLSCFGHAFSSVLLIGSAALRGSGNMRAPMWILGLVSILNVLFSSVLAFGAGSLPAFGMDGIATGTVAARFAGAALMLWLLMGGSAGLTAKPSWASAADFATIGRVLRIGIPAAADSFLMWGGHFLFLRVVAGLGTGLKGEAIFAAHIVGIQIEAINYLPAWAWGTAAATMIGQCLGAGRPDRARLGGHEAMLQSCVMAAVVMVMFLLGAEFIYDVMHEDPAVAAVGVPAIRLLAVFEIPLSITIVYAVGLRGAGETLSPMLINAFGIFVVRLPVGYWLGVEMELGLLGAWAGMGADITARAIAIALYFRYGKWDQKGI